MFTGIVAAIGTITSVEDRGDLRVRVTSDLPLADVPRGGSIACSGACLTVVDLGDDWFDADVSAETRARTAIDWTPGAKLNLERALRLGDELGGHIVTGHVDDVATVADMTADGASTRIAFRVPAGLAPYIAPKGSVTVDGVSLTVNDVVDDADDTRFSINLIPHTQAVTTLGALAPGQRVNIEIDVLARYLKRMADHQSPM